MLSGDRMDYFIVFLRTIFFYFVIFVIYRIMGKREVGQLGIIDLIVSILIAELVVISIENYKDSVWYSLVPIITLTVLQVILALITMNAPKIRNFLDGNPSVIIKNGILNYKEMVKQKYNLDDLLVQLREKGYRSIEEIEYAILEDRTESLLKHAGKKYQENNGNPFKISKKLNKLKSEKEFQTSYASWN